MPLLSIPGAEASRIRKTNKLSSWGNRSGDNRVEPLARPAFNVPFKLKKREKIFTIGSCFARHVELELLNRGYKIPMRDLFEKPAFKGLEFEIVNNFGTPSIFNEFAWAFGEKEFDEDSAFVEVAKDKFLDLHMVSSIKPAPLEKLRERRAALFDATRLLSKCRVMIMTLGLVELWWDSEAELYLNTAPLPSIVKKFPDRFELHVLSFEECYSYLERALAIAAKHGHKKLQILMTVSPVPMMATHRPDDVISANCYSKSVLRAAAEHAASAHDNVTYFPSYETVTLSDRRLAWEDDMIHVTREMVGYNVERMLDAFSGNNAAASGEFTLPEDAGYTADAIETLILAGKAKTAADLMDQEFFREHAAIAGESTDFAVQYARFLFRQKEYDDALSVLEGIEDEEALVLKARILTTLKRHSEAIELIEDIAPVTDRSNTQWTLLMDIAANARRLRKIMLLEQEWLESTPKNEMFIKLQSAIRLSQIKKYPRALARYREVIASEHKSNRAVLGAARSLLEMERPAESLKMLSTLKPDQKWEATLATRLAASAEKKIKETEKAA